MRLVSRRSAPGELGDVRGGKAARGELLEPLRQVEGVARENDLELHLVVQLRLREQPVDVIVDQPRGEIARHVARNERVEAHAHVDVGQPVKTHQQRETAQILIAVVVALIGPDGIGDELAVERQRQRPRPQADDLRRVPVRHDAERSSGCRAGRDAGGSAVRPCVRRRRARHRRVASAIMPLALHRRAAALAARYSSPSPSTQTPRRWHRRRKTSSSPMSAITGARVGGQASVRDRRQRKVSRLSPVPAVTTSVRPERSS